MREQVGEGGGVGGSLSQEVVEAAGRKERRRRARGGGFTRRERRKRGRCGQRGCAHGCAQRGWGPDGRSSLGRRAGVVNVGGYPGTLGRGRRAANVGGGPNIKRTVRLAGPGSREGARISKWTVRLAGPGSRRRSSPASSRPPRQPDLPVAAREQERVCREVRGTSRRVTASPRGVQTVRLGRSIHHPVARERADGTARMA